MSVNRLPALKADSDIFTTFEGDNTVLMQLVAKNLLTDYAASFKGKSKAALLRWAIGQKLGGFISLPRFGERPGGGLGDFKAQLGLFRVRESRLLAGTGRRLRTMTASGRMTAYAAFTAMQNELLALAFAHVERIVLEQFNAAIETSADADLKPALGKLRSLFALCQIEKHRAWYLENGLLSKLRSRAVPGMVDHLCAELRREAVALVDAFGIPPECLAAPIALD